MQTTQSTKKRRPLWLRIFLITALVLGLLVLLLVGVAAVFNKQITRRVLAEVEKNLTTDLEVGDAGLSLISGFPNASVDLKDVKVKDAFGGYLLAAREVSFRFDVRSLFGDRIEVRRVRISGGGVRVRINERGKANYDIFRETAGEEDSSLKIDLENAELKNLLLSFQNARTKQAAEANLRSAGIAGNFSARQFNLSSQADLTVARLQLGDSRYLLGENVRYNAVLAVDLDKGLFDFQNVDLTVGGNTFTVEGIAVDKPAYTELNLKLLSKQGDVSVVFDLLPEPYHSYFNDFQSSGTYDFSGFIRGRAGKNHTPTVGVEVALRNGRLNSEKLQSPLQNVSFRAVYSAPPNGSGVFEIADFQGMFGGEPLNLALKITNLDDPFVEFQCRGALPLAAAYGLLDNPDVTAGGGVVRVNNLAVQGRFADMVNMGRVGQVHADGDVQFEEAEIVYRNVAISARSGRLLLKDNAFTLDSCQIQAGQSDIALAGTARNLLPVLFADSLNTSKALLEFNARLQSRQLDLTQLVGLMAVPETAGEQPVLDSLRTEANRNRQRLTEKLQGTFEATVSNLQYEKIEAQHFAGRLIFDHNQMAVQGDVYTMQGIVQLDGMAYFALSPTLKLRINARDLDLRTCLYQCNNFGQSVVTDQNLRGRMSGRVVVWAFWDEGNNFLLDKLRAFADVSVANGELVNLKMLEDFSNYIHIEDLRQIKFTRLQNYLEINRAQLHIPAMFIQSNALNLTLSGTHSFENEIDYKVMVNAGQLLFNRIKKHDPDLEPLPAQKGWFNVFYTIKGTVDVYDMKRGKKAVKEEFERSEARKQRIASAIAQEFEGAGASAPKPEENVEYLDEITGGGANRQ